MPLCNGENMLPDNVMIVRVSALVAMIIIILRPCESYDPVPLYLRSALDQIHLERQCAIYCREMKEFSQYSLNEKNECICMPSNTPALKNPFETSAEFLATMPTSPTMDFDQKSLIRMAFEQMPSMSSYMDNSQLLIQPQIFQPANYRVYFISSLDPESRPEYYTVEQQSYNDYQNSNRMMTFDEPIESVAGNDYSRRGISHQHYMEPVLTVYPEESMYYSGITENIPQYIEEKATPDYNNYEGFSSDDRRREIPSSVFKNGREGANILSQSYNADLEEINIMHSSEDLENNLMGSFRVNEQNNQNIVGSPLKDSIYIPQYSKGDHFYDESIFANGKSHTFPTHYESLTNLHSAKVPHPYEVENNPNKHNRFLHTPTITIQPNTGGKSNIFPKIITTGDHTNLQPISEFDNIAMINNSLPNTLIGYDPNIFQAKPFQKLSNYNSETNFLSDENGFGFPKSRFANRFFHNLKQKPSLVQSPGDVHLAGEQNKYQIVDSTGGKETPNIVNATIAPLRVQEKNVEEFFLTRANNYGITTTTVAPIIQMIHIDSEGGTSPDQMHSENGHVNTNILAKLVNDLPHVLSIQNNYDNKIIIYSRGNVPTTEISSDNLVKEEKHFVSKEISKDITMPASTGELFDSDLVHKTNFDNRQKIYNSSARLNLELNQNNISPPTDNERMDSSNKTDTIASDIQKSNQLSQLSYILTDEEVDTLPILTKKDANSGVAEDEGENLTNPEENYTDDEFDSDSFTRDSKIASETIKENMFHDKLSKIFTDNIDSFKHSTRVEVSQQIYLRIGKLFLPMYSVATGVDKVDLVLDGNQFCKSDMGMFADNSSDDFLDIVNFVCKQIKTD